MRAPADHREQRASADLRDSAKHRRLDQPRAARFDQRRQLSAGHRLQRAHLDEQLSRHVGFEEAVRTAEDAARAVVFGDAGDDDFGAGGDPARIGGDGQSGRGRSLVGRIAVIPTDHGEALLAQPLRHRRAHSPESDNSKISDDPKIHDVLLADPANRPIIATARKW